MAETTVWDLAEECACSLATVVFQLVNVGAWSADGSVDDAVVETIQILLQDPEGRKTRAIRLEKIEAQVAAKALLDARAYETRVTAEQLASATGATAGAVELALQTLERGGLLTMDEDGTIAVKPESARELAAVALGDLELGGHDAPGE